MNATVRLSADKAELWVATQNAEASLAALRASVAGQLVEVRDRRLGGGGGAVQPANGVLILARVVRLDIFGGQGSQRDPHSVTIRSRSQCTTAIFGDLPKSVPCATRSCIEVATLGRRRRRVGDRQTVKQ